MPQSVSFLFHNLTMLFWEITWSMLYIYCLHLYWLSRHYPNTTGMSDIEKENTVSRFQTTVNLPPSTPLPKTQGLVCHVVPAALTVTEW